MSGRRIPYSDEPPETPEYVETTAYGRIPCPSCGEWIYPLRRVSDGLVFLCDTCAVCGASCIARPAGGPT